MDARQPRSVLVIDESRDSCLLARIILNRSGGDEVSAANGGAAGVATAQGSRPDLILLHLRLPD